MLRLIYGFYLSIFTGVVFAGGIVLLPLGYFAIIAIRIRVLSKLWSIRRKKENFMLSIEKPPPKLNQAICKLVLFSVFGVIQLFF